MNREEVEKILTHGEWFYMNSHNVYFSLIKFDKLITSEVSGYGIMVLKGILLNTLVKFNSCVFCSLHGIKELRPATQKEIIKYFPDEVFPEPKERFKVPIIKAPLLKDELHDIMEALRHSGPQDYVHAYSQGFLNDFQKNVIRKRPITRNKKQHILR